MISLGDIGGRRKASRLTPVSPNCSKLFDTKKSNMTVHQTVAVVYYCNGRFVFKIKVKVDVTTQSFYSIYTFIIPNRSGAF
jgi:hypothetical protein